PVFTCPACRSSPTSIYPTSPASTCPHSRGGSSSTAGPSSWAGSSSSRRSAEGSDPMNKVLAKNVTARCVEALVTGDAVPLHRAQAAIERYVLTPQQPVPVAPEVEHGRVRETVPLQKLVQLTYRSVVGR